MSQFAAVPFLLTVNMVLHADVKPPVPVAPGQPERVDYEYERKGTRNLFVYTPKYGSWLNMAEIEIAIFERKALSRRLENEAALRRQILAVETERNGYAVAFAGRSLRARLAASLSGSIP